MIRLPHPKIQFRYALLYFLLAAAMGLVLRLAYVTPLNFTYRHVVHAHSHIVLLGWVYLAISALMLQVIHPQPNTAKGYTRWYLLAHIALLGMLGSFPLQGYAAVSITFSTLFLFVTYGFYFYFRKLLRSAAVNAAVKQCFQAALLYLVVSSIGPWALGGIMATLGPESVLYRNAIYFYLHFQYNGWMILGITGVALHWLGKRGVDIDPYHFRLFFVLVNTGILLSFFLSTLWSSPPLWMHSAGAIGAACQLLAFLILGYGCLKADREITASLLKNFTPKAIVLLLLLKLLLQALSAHPAVAAVIASLPDLVIGYLHLVFLGVITPGVLLLAKNYKLLELPPFAMALFWTGFFISEGLLFYRALAVFLNLTPLPKQFILLFAASGLLLIGILWITSKAFSKR